MELVAEYRRRAEEAERLAKGMIADDNRRIVLEAVHIWRALADQRERRLNAEARTA